MKPSETLLRIAFFGMKREADDIVEYIAIRFSLLVSGLLGVGMAIWIGKVVGVWSGLIAGFGLYGISMNFCSLAFLHGRQNRKGQHNVR
jgi:hypothetical protein